jgi:hypothetical protein
VKKFDEKLDQAGEFGRQYAQIKADMLSPPVRHRKMETLMEAVIDESDKIVNASHGALVSMLAVLKGVAMRSDNENYDSISNFNEVAGKGTVFKDGLDATITKTETALKILDDIRAVEDSDV